MKGESVAGKEYEIKASTTYFTNWIQYMKMITGITSKFSAAAKNYVQASGFYSGDDEGTGTKTDLVLKSLDAATAISDEILKILKIKKKIDDLKKKEASPVAEDSFLYSLETNSSGETGSKWQTKKFEMAKWLIQFQAMASAMGFLVEDTGAVKSGFDIYNASADDEDTSEGKASKIITHSSKIMHQATGLVSSTVSFLATMEAIEAIHERVGFRIKNSDSYISVQAQTHAAVSSQGPLILESVEGARQADLLTAGLYKKKMRKEFLEAEYPDTTKGSKDYETDKAVRLRTILQRTIAEEISQQADFAILEKAGKVVQLVAGEKEGSKFHAESAKYRGGTMGGEPSFPKKLAYDMMEGNLKDQPLLDCDQEFKSGILLKTREDDQPVLIETDKEKSDLTIRKNQKGIGKDKARMVTLTDDLILIQDREDAFFQMRKESTTLAFDKSNSLVQEKDKAVLTVADKNKLSMDGKKALVDHSAAIALKSGAKMTLNGSKGVNVKTSANMIISAKLVKIC